MLNDSPWTKRNIITAAILRTCNQQSAFSIQHSAPNHSLRARFAFNFGNYPILAIPAIFSGFSDHGDHELRLFQNSR